MKVIFNEDHLCSSPMVFRSYHWTHYSEQVVLPELTGNTDVDIEKSGFPLLTSAERNVAKSTGTVHRHPVPWLIEDICIATSQKRNA